MRTSYPLRCKSCVVVTVQLQPATPVKLAPKPAKPVVTARGIKQTAKTLKLKDTMPKHFVHQMQKVCMAKTQSELTADLE